MLNINQWLASAPGRYAMQWELAQFDHVVANVFGYHALQIGWAQYPCLRNSRVSHKLFVAKDQDDLSVLRPDWDSVLCANEIELPFDNQSIDLVVLPHTFEFSSHPHQLLREVERILIPEGRVVITGFNPWSLWGLRDRVPFVPPYLPNHSPLMTLARLKDWLKLLSFEVDRGRFGIYQPAWRSQTGFDRTALIEKAGDRWWPVCGGVYMLSAIKRVHSMRLLGDARRGAFRQKKVIPVAVSTHKD